MASKNGIKKATTIPHGSSTSVTKSANGFEKGFDTKALTVAYCHPTPRDQASTWRCADHPDPEVFHPTDPAGLAVAVAECAPCPMREACLSLGVARGEWGVWGGVLLEGGKRLDTPRGPSRHSKKSLQAAGAGRVDAA